FRAAQDRVQGRKSVRDEATDDALRVAASARDTSDSGAVAAATSLEDPKGVGGEAWGHEDHADSRCAAAVSPGRPPEASEATVEGDDEVRGDRGRVEEPVIVPEIDHARDVSPMPAGQATASDPSRQGINRVR